MNHPEDWQHRLMIREMLSPTPFSEVLVRETIRPRFERDQGLDARRSVPRPTTAGSNALVFSVIGQCLHYKMARRITERLIGVEGYRELDLEYLTDHITLVLPRRPGPGAYAESRRGKPRRRTERQLTRS